MTEELQQLIKSSKRILITSHISPDPDAVSSTSLLLSTLKLNYPDKEIRAVLEEEPAGLDFIDGYEDIEFINIAKALEDFDPDLFVLLDGNNFDRCSRHEGEKIAQLIKDKDIKVAIIDHHEPEGQAGSDLYINRGKPACAQEIYELCFKDMKLKKPEHAAQVTMVGVYADSGGFVYAKDGVQIELFDLAKELVKDGANIELIKNNLNQYTKDDMHVLATLSDNTITEGDFTYSYLSDDFIDEWLDKKQTYAQLQKPTNAFLNEFIRNIDGRQWGFIVYKNTLQGDNMYSVSLRAVGDTKDVAKIALKLGGGGHKPAAGAKIEAGSLDEALDAVKSAIQLVE